MEGPRDELRIQVGDMIAEPGAEESLEYVLGMIEDELASDVADGAEGDAPEDAVDAVIEWAGLVSHAVARFYAPASPWPRNVAGWSKRAVARLRRVAGLLSAPLQAAAQALGAASWSISIGFPWGISVGLSWP